MESFHHHRSTIEGYRVIVLAEVIFRTFIEQNLGRKHSMER